MENKSTKILAIAVTILVIAFIGAAAYILTGQDASLPDSPADMQTSQTQSTSANPSDRHLPKDTTPTLSPETPSPALTPGSAITGSEKPEPHQVPRHLTDDQKEENRREIAKMAEALPDNMWVPKDPTTGFAPERGERLRKSIELSDKIRKGKATPEEQQEYYSFKLKETTDKIELIRYIAGRTQELSTQTGKEYLTRSDIDTGEERIAELEHLAKKFEQKLSEIAPGGEQVP